ncbi:MAG: hypothetical protein AMK72_02580 [Planctomycetes bacterium SM23_25]|nr:MAG: hypothetical protein AMK72_02580 [Planctomycetes bacterium SM23_25]
MKRAEVHMGHVMIGASGETLTASGVGSCLVITLYDPVHRIGGMAHAMLPPASRAPGWNGRDTKYTDAAIDEMLKRLSARGADTRRLEAKLMGGANMFPGLKSDIGEANVASAKEKLARENIRLAAESVGGSIGRSVEFCSASGIVTVKKKL